MEISEEKLRLIYESTSTDNQEQLEEWYPKVFKPKFKVGGYYKDEKTPCYFKATYIKDSEVYGYGISEGEYYYDILWIYLGDEDDQIQEISGQEFLKQIKKYAVEVLGFKAGAKFKNMKSGFTQTITSGDHRCGNDKVFSGSTLKEEWYHSGSQSNACIFDDGKFAEIVKEESNNNFTYKEPTASIWKKTMDLRWSDPAHGKVLQQKWERIDNGETMWENI